MIIGEYRGAVHGKDEVIMKLEHPVWDRDLCVIALIYSYLSLLLPL